MTHARGSVGRTKSEVDAPPAPTRLQVESTRAVVGWYFNEYHGTQADLGTAEMFCNRDRVGWLAPRRQALARGDPAALAKVLVASSVFQRIRDTFVFGILGRLSRSEAQELTALKQVRRLADGSRCPNAHSLAGLHERCDLGKHAVTRRGTCGSRPRARCHLKRHTELMGRYGDFGKVPTSLVRVLGEAGCADLPGLLQHARALSNDPSVRAELLQQSLCRVWRVDKKISSMFLSAVSNPDLSPGLAPWAHSLDWTAFVVVDGNVDKFLNAVAYEGSATYAARAQFIQRLAARLDLSAFAPVSRFNPRLVQQAMYLFMSAANRRAHAADCSTRGRCAACPSRLRSVCPVGR